MILFPQTDNKCYDNTRISQYKTCPRSYFIRHVLGWRSEGTGLALIFGLSWHDAQDIVWGQAKKNNPFTDKPHDPSSLAEFAFLNFQQTWEENGMPANPSFDWNNQYAPRTPSIAREMLHAYTTARWNMLQEAVVFAIEQPFAVPIPGMPGHWYIGRLDKGVEFNSQRLILEHKTTTAYATIGNFRTDYVDSWYMSSQVKGYEFGGNLFYGDVNAVWVDAALVHKKIHDAFKFIPVAHSFPLVEEWLLGTKKWIAEISEEEENYRAKGSLDPTMFKKNEESCFGKYGPCPYIDICRSVADPSALDSVPGGYVYEKWEPFSILGLDKMVKETENGTLPTQV